jgi:RND family efflux transporter MFP subunit
MAAVGITGCSKSDGAKPAGGKGGGPRPALVKVDKISPGDLTDQWRFLGQVQPSLSAELAAAVAGHVKQVKLREGDTATAKQALVLLDTRAIRADFDATRAREAQVVAELAQAKRELARAQGMDQSVVSEAEKERYALQVDTMSARLASQRADTQRVKVELERHTIRAPFEGVVRNRRVDPGDWVGVGVPVIDLVSLDEVEVHVDVSAGLSEHIQPGATATLLGETRVTANVAGVVSALDESTRTMRVRLVPDERPKWLLAGLALDVEFNVKLAGKGVTVSRDALVRGPVQVRVIKVVDGKPVPVKVEVLATAENRALIVGEGLAAGDTVIIRGNERLRPGQPIKIVEE